MKNRELTAAVILVTVMSSMLTGCGNTQDVATEVSTEVTTPETTMPTETTSATPPRTTSLHTARVALVLSSRNTLR